MIRKILTLKNIGLLQNAAPNGAVNLGEVTAIYAENGRGKSTFAAVMRACELGDAGRLNARRTIDNTNPPQVDLLLSTGAHIEFTANAWTATLPDIIVFDSEFVERNVYSGFEVRPDQRQSLLEFALGDQAVQLKQTIDNLTRQIETQTRSRNQTEKLLANYAAIHTIEQFINMQPVPDAQSQLNALSKRIEAAKSVQQLLARQAPSNLQQINLSIQYARDVLTTQLEDIEEAAEARVHAHIAKFTTPDFEEWLSDGQTHLKGSECPFCGQEAGDLPLLKAYRSYFTQAYDELKQSTLDLEHLMSNELADVKIDSLNSQIATNNARIQAWRDQFDLAEPSIDVDAIRLTLRQVREVMLSLAAAKRSKPLQQIGSDSEYDSITNMLIALNQAIQNYNGELAGVTKKITGFKTNLATDNLTAMRIEANRLNETLKRQEPEVQRLVAEFQSADTERRRLENEKAQARQQVDALMQSTLQQYQTDINQLLAAFGAEFTIEQLQPSYVGSGEPRSDYGLSIRNKSVRLGSRTDIGRAQSFGTTLSDGDKRTLAFAFFIARLKSDSRLSDRILVLDDPVSSLDRNRRHHSLRIIVELAGGCKQLLLLSHDPYFLRETRDALANHKTDPKPTTMLALNRVQNGYSAFDQCDIDGICSSDYYRHHKIVADYVVGSGSANVRDVAKAIRPLLEGYYHRRFPGVIPRGLLLPQLIAHALNPATTGVITFLRPIIGELREINDYASQFHHDTNPATDTVPVVDTELVGFARRALDLIYQNG